MKIINFLLLICLLFFTYKCSTNNILQDEYIGTDGIILGDNVNTDSFKFDSYRLNDLKLDGDSIILNVSFSGGCREHEFNLIAKNYFGDSEAPKAELLLSHNSNFDPCEAYLTEEHSINLLPLKHEFYKKYGNENGSIRLVLEEKEVVYNF
jgi:hypothetical protein